MKRRICILVLIGSLAPFGAGASEASDQAAPDISDQVPQQPATEAPGLGAGDLGQAPPAVDINHPADLLNQPNFMTGRLAAGVIETDNVLRTETDRIHDTIGEVTADVAAHEQTRRLDVDVLSDLQYLTFAHDYFSNELVGNFIGSGTLAIVPQVFEWVTLDNFGQQQLDPAVAATPANLENINYFTVGPNFTLPLSSLLRAQMALRYSNVYYQKSDLNNNRGDASVGLIRSLSALSNVSLNVGAERVDFQDSFINQDYTTEEAYARYEAQGVRTRITADVGYDKVRGLSDTGGGALVHLDLIHVLSPSSKLDFALGQDLSDTSNLMRQLQSINGLAVNGTYLQRDNDPFKSRYGSLTWTFDRFRTHLSADVSRYEERHLEDLALNQDRWQTDVSVRRDIAPTLIAAIGASYARASYSFDAASYNNFVASAALEWRAGRHLNVRAEYDHFDQRGSVPSDELLENGFSYLENRFSLTIGWQVSSGGAPGALATPLR
jgi:hypothetical protein